MTSLLICIHAPRAGKNEPHSIDARDTKLPCTMRGAPLNLCLNCSKQKTLHSKKYGVDLIRFTHGKHAVICESKNKWDGAQ